MIIDREYFETATVIGGTKKAYTFEQISDTIGCYKADYGCEIYFELDTNERIGIVDKADVRTSWKKYYYASFQYKNKKGVRVCTRGDYRTAFQSLMNAYAEATH